MTEQNTNTTYQEQVKADFEEFFDSVYGERYEQAETKQEKLKLEEKAFQEALVDSDDVTGNASGSYYMNRQAAKEMVLDNIDYVANVINNKEWTTKPLEKYIVNNEWESLDVIARYHTLYDLWYDGEFNEFF